MPHEPLYVPDDVLDKDPKNTYTNTIEHIDAEVGRVLNTVKDLGLDKRLILSSQPIMAPGGFLNIMAAVRYLLEMVKELPRREVSVSLELYRVPEYRRKQSAMVFLAQ